MRASLIGDDRELMEKQKTLFGYALVKMTVNMLADFIISLVLLGLAAWVMPQIYRLFVTAGFNIQILLLAVGCVMGALWMALIFTDNPG